MEKDKNITFINKYKQQQLLKLVTKSFYNELQKFGVNSSDVVTISIHLLDNLLQKNGKLDSENNYYNQYLIINKITNEWESSQQFSYESVSISPLQLNIIPKIADWLKNPIIKDSFISRFPEDENDLYDYFNQKTIKYFLIQYKNKPVGLIGAENIDKDHSKLEMKKFIGMSEFRGKGIGKRATFLFLFYVFNILKFNKIYIFSKNTNIRNINLNAKFGFELEGIFFEDIILNNQKQDIIRMGLLKSKWQKIFSAK
ncbi:MAG: GNAT family N-acetyltransferase [Candidatus Helarchaeota archaeon]